MRCSGHGRVVTTETWRSYYRCPTCDKRLSHGERTRHPNPRYVHVVVPAHEAKKPA